MPISFSVNNERPGREPEGHQIGLGSRTNDCFSSYKNWNWEGKPWNDLKHLRKVELSSMNNKYEKLFLSMRNKFF